ncbi:MAG: hypothetical protein ABIF19_02375 [Planctomycetota bacterium]
MTKSLYFGLVAGMEDSQLSDKALLKAHRVGEKLTLGLQAWK